MYDCFKFLKYKYKYTYRKLNKVVKIVTIFLIEVVDSRVNKLTLNKF